MELHREQLQVRRVFWHTQRPAARWKLLVVVSQCLHRQRTRIELTVKLVLKTREAGTLGGGCFVTIVAAILASSFGTNCVFAFQHSMLSGTDKFFLEDIQIFLTFSSDLLSLCGASRFHEFCWWLGLGWTTALRAANCLGDGHGWHGGWSLLDRQRLQVLGRKSVHCVEHASVHGRAPLHRALHPRESQRRLLGEGWTGLSTAKCVWFGPGSTVVLSSLVHVFRRPSWDDF